MKRFMVLMALLGGVLFVAPAPAQAGVATASVTIVNAVAFDAPQDFPLTVCIDGTLEVADLSTEDSHGPVDMVPDSYQFDFYQGSDCSGDPDFSEELDIPAGPSTVMAYWSPGGGQTAVVFADDLSCVEEGLTRVTFRHGASDAPADWFITPDGGSPEEAISNVASGEQGVASDLVAQTYEASELREAGLDLVLLDTGSPGDLTTTTAYYLYFFGGADGDTGYFTSSVQVEECTPETTTTAAPTTTTTTAAAAAVVTPRFTG